MCSKLVVKIHALGGLKRLTDLPGTSAKKHVNHGHVEGAKCGAMMKTPKISMLLWAGTMKCIGAFTRIRSPPCGLLGKGLCWRYKGTRPYDEPRIYSWYKTVDNKEKKGTHTPCPVNPSLSCMPL
jgi:hypothetical protein